MLRRPLLSPHKSFRGPTFPRLNPSTPIYHSHRRFSSSTEDPKHLKGLNDVQRKAVKFPADAPLQILAGPGSGKTRVLTARITELVQRHKIAPSSICAVTFTRKAAHEMRSRLTGHMGATNTEQLILGTFHSVCLRYIREYGFLIDIPPNFEIWDEEECTILIRYIALRYRPEISLAQATWIRQKIADAKGGPGDNPKEAFYNSIPPKDRARSKDPFSSKDREWLGKVFDDYHETLRISNALDFEDLLRRCLEIFKKAPWVPRLVKLQHVLVDEFQDTSELQYRLLRKMFGATKGRITIVGDPDQAIYRWRQADIANFKRMKRDLPNTEEHLLEENYRSTGSTLAFSLGVIEQDPNRPSKSLFTSQAPDGPKPVLKHFRNTEEESEFIANEIQRLVDTSEGVFGYGDCAILLREHSQSWDLLSTLRNKGIPCRVLPESSAFDVPECNILLAYLRVAVNSAYTPLLCFALDAGPPNIDPTLIARLVGQGIDEKRRVFDVLAQICSTSVQDISLPVQICGFARTIYHLRKLLDQGAGPAELLEYVHSATNYDSFLEQRSKRWAPIHKKNVGALLKFAGRFSRENGYGSPVRDFLEAIRSMSKANNMDVGKVTILTCHSAKGLEWPIVFVPEVVDGVYPHRRTEGPEEEDEERRLLYVACTRAQCLLYLTLPEMKMIGPKEKKESIRLYPSDFVEKVAAPLSQDDVCRLNRESLALFRKLLGERKKTPRLVPVD